MFCTNCGGQIGDNARFCPDCGQPVEGSPSPQQPVQAPAPVQPPPAAGQPAPEPPAAPAPAPQAPPPPEQAPPQSAGQYIPPSGGYGAPSDGYGAPKKKRNPLPFLIIAVVVVVLAAAGFVLFRYLSNNAAFEENMAAGQKHLTDGHYGMAVSSFEAALERKPDNADAALGLAEAHLRQGSAEQAGQLLSGLVLEEGDERAAKLNRLTGLTALLPEVEEVDPSSFPTVCVDLDLGSDVAVSSSDLTLTEGGIPMEIASLEQQGSKVRLTYRTEDTGVSEERRDLSLLLEVDGLSFQNEADYLTPYFEPAQLTLVSTDVSEYPKVKAFFRVSNSQSGQTVKGLDANSFTILERVEGGEYLAREVKSALPLEGNAGLNIDLVADKSDSISSADMNKIKNVMIEFVNNLHYSVGDRAELLAFDSIVQQMCYYTGDVSLLINGINNMSTDGLTAFYDAVYDGVTNAALQGGARCVIAFTDGQDNRSRYSANEVVRYANQRQVPVYIIGVGNSVDAGTLRSMAQSTGGRYWHINDLYDLQEIFDQVYAEQKELYVVEYESDGSLDSYLPRDLSVQVSGGGCRGEAETSFTPVRSIKDGGGAHTSRYVLIDECLSWEEASRRCQEMGGHLATITSQDEMDLLVEMAASAGKNYIWLGGYTSYDDNGSVFGHWVTGEDFSYQNWSVDEPSRVDRDGTEEWYIMLWNIPSLGGWTWNDQRNDPAAAVPSMAEEMAFICEFEV